MFRDFDRLARIVTHSDHPVQLVFAGKAHPADEAGKHHLQNIFKRALDPRLAGRIAFVDDYDLHVAHLLVQGCDIWLNTPRKPLEASGTSGMKASMNGTLHLSIGDGWWAEGCTGSNGWVISGKPDSQDTDAVDTADANALYTLLEDEIVPSFYERDARTSPPIAMVKQAILTVTPRSRRMLKEHGDTAYLPAFKKRPATHANERDRTGIAWARSAKARQPRIIRRSMARKTVETTKCAIRRQGSHRTAQHERRTPGPPWDKIAVEEIVAAAHARAIRAQSAES